MDVQRSTISGHRDRGLIEVLSFTLNIDTSVRGKYKAACRLAEDLGRLVPLPEKKACMSNYSPDDDTAFSLMAQSAGAASFGMKFYVDEWSVHAPGLVKKETGLSVKAEAAFRREYFGEWVPTRFDEQGIEDSIRYMTPFSFRVVPSRQKKGITGFSIPEFLAAW